MLYKFLIAIYLKYFFIILIALELLFIGIDYLGQYTYLPNSANLKLLYIFYNTLGTLKITLPISLVFGVIVSKIHIIKRNELVSIYALGASRSRVLLPFFSASLVVVAVFVLAQGFYFYDAKTKSQDIINKKFASTQLKDLFLTYNDDYIYIASLNPVLKQAENFIVFRLLGGELVQKMQAQRGSFSADVWSLENVTLTDIVAFDTTLQASAIKESHQDKITALEGFKPSIIDSVYEWKEILGFRDLINSIWLMHSQGISTEKLRGIIYSNYLVPFFAPLFTIFIFFAVPISVRFFNVAAFSSLAVFVNLGVWGVLFVLSQLASTSSLNPEVAIILPFLLVSILAGYLFKRHL